MAKISDAGYAIIGTVNGATTIFIVADSGTTYRVPADKIKDFINGQITPITATTLTGDLNDLDTRVTNNLNNKVAKAGDTMTGILTLSGDPTNPLEAATKQYVDGISGDFLKLDGTTVMIGNIDSGGNRINNVGTPAVGTDAANKDYVDSIAGFKLPTIAIDCSTNPGYPAATVGDAYEVTVAGKIGGGGGPSVEVGDIIVCKNTTAGGIGAGGDFFIIQANTIDATVSNKGVVELATDPEALDDTETQRVLTPSNLDHVLRTVVYDFTPLTVNTALPNNPLGLYDCRPSTGIMDITLPDITSMTSSEREKAVITFKHSGANNKTAVRITAGGSSKIINPNGAAFSGSEVTTAHLYYKGSHITLRPDPNPIINDWHVVNINNPFEIVVKLSGDFTLTNDVNLTTWQKIPFDDLGFYLGHNLFGWFNLGTFDFTPANSMKLDVQVKGNFAPNASGQRGVGVGGNGAIGISTVTSSFGSSPETMVVNRQTLTAIGGSPISFQAITSASGGTHTLLSSSNVVLTANNII